MSPKGRKLITRGVSLWNTEHDEPKPWKCGRSSTVALLGSGCVGNDTRVYHPWPLTFAPTGLKAMPTSFLPSHFLAAKVIEDFLRDLADENLRRVVDHPALILVLVGHHAQRDRARFRVDDAGVGL